MSNRTKILKSKQSLSDRREISKSKLKRSKTHKRLKGRFLSGRNRRNRAHFRKVLFFKLRTTEKQTINSSYFVSVKCSEVGTGFFFFFFQNSGGLFFSFFFSSSSSFLFMDKMHSFFGDELHSYVSRFQFPCHLGNHSPSSRVDQVCVSPDIISSGWAQNTN